MEKSLWSIEGVPIKVTWDEWFDQTLSKWMESMRNEWIEVNRGEMSDLKDLTLWTLWEWSYGQKKVSLSKWLEWTLWESPYQNEWNRWEMNELSEMSEMKWNEWMDGIDLEQPYGKVPMVDRRCPYQSDLRWVKINVPIKMNGFDEIWMKWVNRGE